jgi:hypothetical protein
MSRIEFELCRSISIRIGTRVLILNEKNTKMVLLEMKVGSRDELELGAFALDI